jgi:hypothetical protein
MQSKRSTSPPSTPRLNERGLTANGQDRSRSAQLAQRLAAAEAAYERKRSRRNLSRIVTWYHRLYWATVEDRRR